MELKIRNKEVKHLVTLQVVTGRSVQLPYSLLFIYYSLFPVAWVSSRETISA